MQIKVGDSPGQAYIAGLDDPIPAGQWVEVTKEQEEAFTAATGKTFREADEIEVKPAPKAAPKKAPAKKGR